MEFLGTTGRKPRHSGSFPRAQCYERIEYYPVDLQALAECAAQASASAIGQQIDVFHASTNREIDTAFAALVQRQDAAVLVIPDALFFDRRVQLVMLAVRHAVPAIYASREYAEAGGLMSYGTDLADVLRQVGAYAGTILKGAKPADF